MVICLMNLLTLSLCWLFIVYTPEVIPSVTYNLQVLLRYGLQKLFGPGHVGATSDQSYMYLDLPSNMVTSNVVLPLLSKMYPLESILCTILLLNIKQIT